MDARRSTCRTTEVTSCNWTTSRDASTLSLTSTKHLKVRNKFCMSIRMKMQLCLHCEIKINCRLYSTTRSGLFSWLANSDCAEILFVCNCRSFRRYLTKFCDRVCSCVYNFPIWCFWLSKALKIDHWPDITPRMFRLLLWLICSSVAFRLLFGLKIATNWA